jgi:hypothetical protein
LVTGFMGVGFLSRDLNDSVVRENSSVYQPIA